MSFKKIIYVITFIMIIAAGSVFATGLPHPLYVNVQNGSSVSPATGDLTFEAWLTNDPTSVLTENSTGCFYTVPPGVGVECGNFATAWTAGNVVHIEVEQISTGDVGTGEFTLTFANMDVFSGVDGIIIGPPSWSDNFNGGTQQIWTTLDQGTNSTYSAVNDRYELHTEYDTADGIVASYVGGKSGTDCIIQAKIEQINVGDKFLTFLLARTDATTMCAYTFGISSGNGSNNEPHLWLGKLAGGVYSNLSGGSILPWGAGNYEWYDCYLKFAVVGTNLYGKVWKTTESEPDEWQVEATDSDYASGVAGVMLSTYHTLNWDVVQVAIDDVSFSDGLDEVWIDDDYTVATLGWGSTHFDNISDGVNAVDEDGTVNVAAGPYNENVVINKQLTLQGAGSGSDPISNTIISSFAPNTDVIQITAGGSSETDRLVIQDIQVTGAIGGSNYGMGIEIGSLIGHIEFNNVTSTGNEGEGIGLNVSGTIADIVVNNCNLSNNGSAGFRMPESIGSFSGLTISNSQIENNGGIGLLVYSDGGTDFTVSNTTFSNNATGINTEGNIVFSGFNGDATLSNVTITSANAESAIRVTGESGTGFGPAGTISLSSITVNGTQAIAGTYPSAAIVLSRYTDVSSVSFSAITLNSIAPSGIFLGTLYNTPAPSIDLSGISFSGTYTQLITLGQHGNNSSYEKSNVAVDATSGVSFGISDNYAIEDMITHKLDDADLGLVTWVANNDYVTPSSGSVQRGIDAATDGDVVNVAAGTYTEAILIDKPLTVSGATAGVNKNGYTVPAAYAWDPAVESIINHPDPSTGYETIVDIVDTDNVTFEGFIVQELHAEANKNSSLVRVYAHTQEITNIIVRNNIIGPNTHITAQDGAQGRMGLYIVNHPYSGDYGVVNSTFSGNKIFDCQGNGNNIFIWSSYYFYGAANPASMAGTVIEDNEIYGARRSGLESAGGYSYLTIQNNKIYGNSSTVAGSPYDDMLKYGHGILLIRGSSDKTGDSEHAYGPTDLTIHDNDIHGNGKSGIYMGPMNTNYTITDNDIYDNGWNGILLDLEARHWNGTFEPAPDPLDKYAIYNGSSNLTASDNNISSNGDGDDYGIQVNGTPTNGFVFDATNNYWGPNGPESVVSGNVAYIPWWADEAMTIVGGQPVTNQTQNTSYATIQAAIDAAAAGDVIYVAAGTYNENYSSSCALKIDKSITLIGTGLPTVDGVGTHAIVAQVESDNVTIRGMKFVNSSTGANAGIGVYLFGFGTGYTCENTTLESCEISNNEIGLFLAEANGATINENTFTGNTYRSIIIQQDSDNNIVKGNTIAMTGAATEAAIVIGTDSGDNVIGVEGNGNTISMPTSTSLGDDHMPFGIYMSGIGASDNTIQYNAIDGSASMVQINDNTGTTTVQENEFGMTTAPFFRGVQLNGSGGSLILSDNYLKNTVRPVEFWGADVTVTGNTIDETTFDFINVHTFTGTVAINYNKFINCGTHFLNNQTTTEINAEKNYWGTAIGPIGTVNNPNPIDNITARIAVSDNVDFMPWYATATTTPSTELATLKGNYGSKAIIEVFTSDALTTALANCDDGDEIVLGSGTFTGNFLIEDDITLSAASGAVPVIQTALGNTEPALTVTSYGTGGVILEGLTFTACSTAVTVTAATAVTISSSNFDVTTDGTTVENNTGTEVSAQQNYWGTTGTVGGTGTVDATNPIENDPVVINVTPATGLIKGNEAGNYNTNIGVVSSLRAFQIEIMFDKTDFNAPDIGTSPGIAQCGDFYLGSLLVDAAANVAECYTQFFVDDLTDAGEDYYTYRVTGSIFGATSAAVATGTGQLFYIKDLTSSTSVTNLDGSIISLAFIYARDENNGTILCNGITDATITIDSVIPVIAEITDAQNGYYATAPVLSSISFSDNYNVDKIDYQYDGGSWIELGVSSTLETSWLTSDWTLIGFDALTDELSHTIYFQATDEAGNTSSNISWQFNKNTTAPVALTWKVVDNDHYPETTPNANNSIALDWDNTNSLYANIHIWRKAFDDFDTNTGYPTYTGTAPTSPTLPADPKLATDTNGWTKVTKADITSFTNTLDTRGFYYYVLYVEGSNEVISAASVVSPSLSYWLGDIDATPDGEVKSSDIALLGAAWNTTPTGSILDVGPTTDNSRNARPVPDNAIDFEDLMIFAMNYENTDYTVYSKKQIPLPQPIFIDIVTSINGNQLIAELILDDNNGFVRGLHIPVNYGNGLVLNSVTSGDIWNSTDFFIYSNKDNCLEVDGSALGELGIVENNGTIAILTFDIVGDNMDLLPGIAIARSVDNEEIECTGFALDADDEPLPTVYNLYQNYPNPFNQMTNIMFALPQASKVEITVYNIRGQLVDELTNEDFNAGNHVVEWNNPDLKPGMYFYRIKTDNYTKVKKCLLIR